MEAAGLADIVESADELTLEQLLSVQAMVRQEFADNAVSFTADVDPAKYSPQDMADTSWHFANKLKGFTVFPERDSWPYERITRQDYEDRVDTTELVHVEHRAGPRRRRHRRGLRQRRVPHSAKAAGGSRTQQRHPRRPEPAR